MRDWLFVEDHFTPAPQPSMRLRDTDGIEIGGKTRAEFAAIKRKRAEDMARARRDAARQARRTVQIAPPLETAPEPIAVKEMPCGLMAYQVRWPFYGRGVFQSETIISLPWVSMLEGS